MKPNVANQLTETVLLKFHQKSHPTFLEFPQYLVINLVAKILSCYDYLFSQDQGKLNQIFQHYFQENGHVYLKAIMPEKELQPYRMAILDWAEGFKQKQNQDVPIKQAAYWSIAWVSVAVMFGGGLWFYLQQTVGVGIANQKTMEYFAGYLLEKSLAIDNVFVWLMILSISTSPVR